MAGAVLGAVEALLRERWTLSSRSTVPDTRRCLGAHRETADTQSARGRTVARSPAGLRGKICRTAPAQMSSTTSVRSVRFDVVRDPLQLPQSMNPRRYTRALRITRRDCVAESDLDQIIHSGHPQQSRIAPV
jgi:hypothetical protein